MDEALEGLVEPRLHLLPQRGLGLRQLERLPGAVHLVDEEPQQRRRRPMLGKLRKLAIFCKFLAGSFSAVSKRNFARKYAFDSLFQALQDLHPFAPLQAQNFRKKSV